MAHIRLDHDFGLQGCTSHIDGFGTPLGIFVDNDGRPTIVCAAPSQRSADRATTPAGRYRAPPVTTVRIASFPPSGRPLGASSERVAISADAVAEDFMPSRAVTHLAHIAVLGEASRAGRVSPAVLVYRTGATCQPSCRVGADSEDRPGQRDRPLTLRHRMGYWKRRSYRRRGVIARARRRSGDAASVSRSSCSFKATRSSGDRSGFRFPLAAVSTFRADTPRPFVSARCSSWRMADC